MSDMMSLFFDSRSKLGEGPFWHPTRGELFFFDINSNALHRISASGEALATYPFSEAVSAAALIDNTSLLVAAASGLRTLDIETGSVELALPLEADKMSNRSNDSRVSPHGTWWVSTMATDESGAHGAVYGVHGTGASVIMDNVTIPNSICFSPDGELAYFTDTPTRKILRAQLDQKTGLPISEWEVFVALPKEQGNPDGSVVDGEGFLWNAEYGGGRVTRYDPSGKIDRMISVPTRDVTCPAFGGQDLKTLFVTTSSKDMSAEDLEKYPNAGSVFSIDLDVAGIAETPVNFTRP